MYSSGIGLAIVAQLATHGAKAFFTARSLEKAEKAKQAVLQSCPSANPDNIDFLLLDLTVLRSINDAADLLRRKASKIDILSMQGLLPHSVLSRLLDPNTFLSVNNAAASTASTELVGGGWEVHITTKSVISLSSQINIHLTLFSFIGPFLFINRLMPLLKEATLHKNADVRIINISSTAPTAFLPRDFDFQFDKLSGLVTPVLHYPLQWRLGAKYAFSWDMIRFSVSKAALILFATELQRRLDAQGVPILTLSVHPGSAYTEGLAAVNNFFISTMARLFFDSAEQGAVSPLFAATAEQVRQSPERYKAKFLLPVGKIGSPHPVAEDERQIKGLWVVTITELNKALEAQGLPVLGPW